ncbi:hypothetical protein AKJ64_03625 [candidate division MSBL1 archaeon SCGC-AAA259E17]|uniref:Uncharacterized protein n=1 Tax=candidate division MSBL1 archaeon SCGC-AAA259E17 TaxID=1698263 RepID=A0A133UDI0_9EURY|nr:hypothetical protein AKJ64_03625 [candidate division MSBL1 archaeon SCGC-AAA259E17]
MSQGVEYGRFEIIPVLYPDPANLSGRGLDVGLKSDHSSLKPMIPFSSPLLPHKKEVKDDGVGTSEA